MAKSINISAPNLGFGSFGMASCQVEITENGTALSTRLYYFNIHEFSAFADTVNVNYGSIHFGQHQITLSNGDYTTLLYSGTPVTNAYQVVDNLAQAVLALT